MKTRMPIRALVRACSIVAMALLSAQGVVAETKRDVSKEISELRSTIVSVEVYLGPSNVTFRQSLTEHDVVRMACRRNLSPQTKLS